MDTLWQVILAAMLFLQPPGMSPLSVVEASKDTPAPCSAPSLLCRAPRWSEAHQEWVVTESWRQGLARYATIARSVAKAAPDDAWLMMMLLTTFFYESGFRRDIHSGVGKFALGDGKQSWCLGQIHLGRRSPKGRSLVGVDQAATDRCVRVAATYLASKKRAKHPRGVFFRYVGAGADPEHIDARVWTFRRLTEKAPTVLDEEVRRALGIDEATTDPVR